METDKQIIFLQDENQKLQQLKEKEKRGGVYVSC